MYRRPYIYSKIITFLPNPSLGNEKFPFTSNPVPNSEYLYLSISAFFTNLTVPSKEFPSGGITTVYTVPQIYFINNVYVYCFSMSKCNFILF